jgi:hypothetical protein
MSAIRLVEKADDPRVLLPESFVGGDLWKYDEWRLAHKRVPNQDTVLSENILNDVVHGVKRHDDHTDNE